MYSIKKINFTNLNDRHLGWMFRDEKCISNTCAGKSLLVHDGFVVPVEAQRNVVSIEDFDGDMEVLMEHLDFTAWLMKDGVLYISGCPERHGEILGSRGLKIKALQRALGMKVVWVPGQLVYLDSTQEKGTAEKFEAKFKFKFRPAVSMNSSDFYDLVPQKYRGHSYKWNMEWMAPWVKCAGVKLVEK